MNRAYTRCNAASLTETSGRDDDDDDEVAVDGAAMARNTSRIERGVDDEAAADDEVAVGIEANAAVVAAKAVSSAALLRREPGAY